MAFPNASTPRLRRPVERDRDGFAAVWADPDVWLSLRPGLPGDVHHAELGEDLHVYALSNAHRPALTSDGEA